ncbi:Mrp/NBP35 family ATP-binding protein [Microterricola pindariensis]|uniref:Iron-sulfur cluster carrier protein n=1 Tax=Microterricola pindariensis TaxID=478010 RepID=A0ABX5AY52_9MICO|nr:P-loop NTPase [Microterricola pindariensis]PPL19326.1 sodium:proton antiporter [Microterricola pindariensis]
MSASPEPAGIRPAGIEALHQALARVIDPEIRRPITDLDMVGELSLDDAGRAHAVIKLTIIGCPAARRIEDDSRAALEGVVGAGNVELAMTVMSVEERKALTAKLQGTGTRTMPFTPDSLTRVIAVTSGKGGVGKSTLTANLAVALAARGLRVGLLDADVHGFSIPGLLGLAGVKPTRVGEMILPPVAFGVKVISIGMFLDDTSAAVAWRGPMLHRTINQFLTDVYFGDLDVLLLDLPPGTGDVAISIGQLLPHAEVLVVTTPQPAAADVAERSGVVARQTGQSVFGVIENMAGLAQPDGTVLELFGSGGGAEVASRLGVPLLARIPLSVPLREGGDTGSPIVLSDPDDAAAAAILGVADALASTGRGLAGRPLPLSFA